MRRYEFPWRVLDAVLPSTCFCCGERLRASQSMGACARCWLGLEPALEATPVAAAGPVVSVIRYGRAARRFLLRAKFGGHPELFGPMGRMVTAAVRLRGIRPSCVVPVPSHPFDTWARGFTPGLEIARTVAAALGLPVRRHLVRRWAPRASMKRLDRASRKSLSVRAFRPVEPVRGETVLVVDDLLTTGSTLSACIAVCAAQGASEIHAAVWAKAPSFFN